MMLHSMHFGRAFWLDDDNEFCSCPWRKDGTVEDLNWDYVSEWDMEGVNFDRLFDIHRTLTIEKHNEALEDFVKIVNYMEFNHEKGLCIEVTQANTNIYITLCALKMR